jgi:hypothetical protein
MSHCDARGLPLTTSSASAAARYRHGCDLLLATWPGAAEALDASIASDPDFALAYAARARLHAIRAEPAEARAVAGRATELAERHGTERERSHTAIIALAVAGQSTRALASVLNHLDQWPCDAVIFALPMGAFGLLAFSGKADHDQARVDLCERHSGAFATDDWWFLTYRGWSHTENGALKLGRELSEQALELRRENANAAHAVSHAMFELGAGDEAERLIAGWLPGYDRSGILHGHLAWHAALSALDRGDAANAVEFYEQHVQPAVSRGAPLNVMTDAVSFLWRLQAYGHDVPEGAWQSVATFANPAFPKPGLAFADVHMGLLGAATGDSALAARIASLEALLEAGTLAAGPVVPAICRAALAFAAEEYSRCIRLLEPVANEVVRLGGSGAQREIFEDMLLVSLMKIGDSASASVLLDKRLHRRPSSRDVGWKAALAS